MSKNISVLELKVSQHLDNEAFSLKEFERKLSAQGKPYYNVKLGDKSGEIRAKVWSESIRSIDEKLKLGDIVEVSGVVQVYADKPQVIIEKMSKCQSIAPEEFLPITSRSRSDMTKVLEDEIEKTKNPYLKKLLDLFWSNQEYKDKFINFPAGEYVHHGYVGGLIEHVYEMLEMSRPYFILYPMLDRDVFFTGLFFHDIGKLEELDIVGSTIVRTSEGKLVAHIGQGLLFVSNLLLQVPDFPADLKNKLFHLILSHQGKLEMGSPIKPQTLEALVLSFVDTNSADMNQAVKHIEKNVQTGADFTEYHKWLGRGLYQKDYLDNPSETFPSRNDADES